MGVMIFFAEMPFFRKRGLICEEKSVYFSLPSVFRLRENAQALQRNEIPNTGKEKSE